MTSLVVNPREVPPGASVRIYDPWTRDLATDPEGNLLPPLTLLGGGVPTRLKWYILEDNDGKFVHCYAFEYRQLLSGVLLAPVETCTPTEAEQGRIYTVFVDRELLRCEGSSEPLKVTPFNGQLYAHGGRIWSPTWARVVKLPSGAVLVPVGRTS